MREFLGVPTDQPRIIEFMVVAHRAADNQYFYARESVTEALADVMPEDRLAAFMFQNLTRDVLEFEHPDHGRIGNDARWWGATHVRLIPDLDEFLDS